MEKKNLPEAKKRQTMPLGFFLFVVVTWQVIAIFAIGDSDGGSLSHSCVSCCSQPHTDLERGRSTLYISIIEVFTLPHLLCTDSVW